VIILSDHRTTVSATDWCLRDVGCT